MVTQNEKLSEITRMYMKNETNRIIALEVYAEQKNDRIYVGTLMKPTRGRTKSHEFGR